MNTHTLKIVSIADLDQALRFVRGEVQILRGRKDSPAWAERKAKSFEDIESILLAIRRQEQMKGMNGQAIDVNDLEQRLRSAETIISQVAQDTFGREMTPKEYAAAAGYDS